MLVGCVAPPPPPSCGSAIPGSSHTHARTQTEFVPRLQRKAHRHGQADGQAEIQSMGESVCGQWKDAQQVSCRIWDFTASLQLTASDDLLVQQAPACIIHYLPRYAIIINISHTLSWRIATVGSWLQLSEMSKYISRVSDISRLKWLLWQHRLSVCLSICLCSLPCKCAKETLK